MESFKDIMQNPQFAHESEKEGERRVRRELGREERGRKVKVDKRDSKTTKS